MDAKRLIPVVAITALVCLALTQAVPATSFFDLARKAAEPLLTGCVIAYLTNLLMARIERVLFPHTAHSLARKARRPLAIVISFAMLISLACLVIVLVASQLHSTVSALSKGAAAAWEAITSFVEATATKSEAFASASRVFKLDEMASSAMSRFGNSDTLVNSAIGIGDSLVRAATNLGLGAVFSVYLLMAKERVSRGAQTLSRRLLPPLWDNRLRQAAVVANESFSHFIVGQCAEALILGSLCFIGMSILQLPHALTVALCVGASALIPLFGAWIGGIVGALIILPVSPEKALAFLLFLALLQAFENHVIYPRTMKHATGVSTIWVFASVIVGGAMGGVVGIVLAVPLVATGQELYRRWWSEESPSDYTPVPSNGGMKLSSQAPPSCQK